MTAALEVKARTNAVNDKITYATEVIFSRQGKSSTNHPLPGAIDSPSTTH